ARSRAPRSASARLSVWAGTESSWIVCGRTNDCQAAASAEATEMKAPVEFSTTRSKDGPVQILLKPCHHGCTRDPADPATVERRHPKTAPPSHSQLARHPRRCYGLDDVQINCNTVAQHRLDPLGAGPASPLPGNVVSHPVHLAGPAG